MPKNALVRKIVAEGELRVEDLRKKVEGRPCHNTVLNWITHGRIRRTDGKLIHLEAIKGPDGGYRTSEGCYVRFLEKLNARPQ